MLVDVIAFDQLKDIIRDPRHGCHKHNYVVRQQADFNHHFWKDTTNHEANDSKLAADNYPASMSGVRVCPRNFRAPCAHMDVSGCVCVWVCA